ncbi:guanine nucleotide-binding protein subunit beta-like protein 1 [Cylas formicarius]|uniref:guanine nucleotide-binding protein subunit beta-like protein 1 n=1 Tax=Cylas formicarius TaxID=197179 RepID=UPI0029585D8C|nr:guanine nucleotide-binding protein subunit beta-like protein 1 [Cylas formicarius]
MPLLPPDPVFCLKQDMGHVHSMSFTKINNDYTSQLLAATEKGDVFFWDLETNRLQHKQRMGESIQTIHSVEYDIITQEKSGLVKLWSIENNTGYKVQKTFQCYGGFCKSVILENQQLILPGENSVIDVVDVDNFENVKKFVPDKEKLGNVMCLQPIEIRRGRFLLAGYATGDIILFDYNTEKQCGHLKLNEFLTSLTFDPFTCRGVVANASNALQVFGIDPECLRMELKCELALTNQGCNVVKFRPDRKLLFAGGWDGRLRVFSWKTLRALVVLTEHKKAISDIQFSPHRVRLWDSNIIAASGEDGLISLWNVYHNYTY